MYSVILATILTTSAVTPAWGHHGCRGCYGGCYGCSGCYGSCSGCYGSCSGCFGCFGCSGCYGCYGSCYGSCSGCSGCYGSCYGSCYGACSGSCYGCCGGGCYGSRPAVPAVPTPKEAIPAPKGVMEKMTMSRVVVTVPEDATLYVDGQKSRMTSRERTFVTPKLQTGERYYYDLRAEAVRDGQVKTINRRVLLSAGEIARVDLTELGEPTTDSSAHVTVKLPRDARMFVDGTPIEQKSNVRKFTTPKLSPGQLYYYTVKVELDRDGKTLTDSQRVVVEAGKTVEVSFEKAFDTHTASR